MRCSHCLDVLWSRHPWDVATCSCGAVAVSGRPADPRVDWHAAAPGGWAFVDVPEDQDEVCTEQSGATGAGAGEQLGAPEGQEEGRDHLAAVVPLFTGPQPNA
ncbi:MAG: DUF7695 domain-containing protein [Acidimicrobiales bacterium]